MLARNRSWPAAGADRDWPGLYHLAQHRGFWSAQVERPKTKEEEKEAGVVKEAIAALGLTAMGDQTLGAGSGRFAGRRRQARPPSVSRTMIEIEFALVARAGGPSSGIDDRGFALAARRRAESFFSA